MDLDHAALRAALAAPSPAPIREQPPGARPAAVAVPVALTPAPTVLLVLRASHLAEHAGEVGFPGGKPEGGDADLLATALRETEEEVGLSPAELEPLGALSPCPVINGKYVIHPFVVLVRPGARARVASPEVARVLELPLAPILDGTHPIRAVATEVHGVQVLLRHIEIDGAILYGASAYVLFDLVDRIARVLGRTPPEPEIVTERPWATRYPRS